MPEIDEPVADVAADQRARTDAALARLRASEQRIAIDHEALEAWEESRARDYDVEQVN